MANSTAMPGKQPGIHLLTAGTLARLRTLSERHQLALLNLHPGPGAVWRLDWRAMARPGRRLVGSVIELQVTLDATMPEREAYALKTVELFLAAIEPLLGTPTSGSGNGTLHGQAMAEVRA
jgi:hypothetical protein